jgi:hypothetical protein
MCLVEHEPSWRFARLHLIGLLASYRSRRIYQVLQAPVRPVRHACRFLRNRKGDETVDENYGLSRCSKTIIACQYGPRDTCCLVRQSNGRDARVSTLHDGLDPTAMPVIAPIHKVHDRAGTLHQ